MGPGANYTTTRRMANGAAVFLMACISNSRLYVPATTTTSSSSCSGGANTCYLGTGDGSAQSVPSDGQVPIVAVAPAPGTYTDTVTMTITY